MNLTTQNSVSPTCTFGVVTKGLQYLAAAYMDHNAVKIDALYVEQEELRKGALEAVDSFTVETLAGLLAGILSEVDSAKSLKALRASAGVLEALEGTVEVSEFMVSSGVSRRITALIHQRTRHSETSMLWGLATHLEIKGDLKAYFDDQTLWPRISGDDAMQYQCVLTRVAILERIDILDLTRLMGLVNDHLKRHAELVEAEVKNSKGPSAPSAK